MFKRKSAGRKELYNDKRSLWSALINMETTYIFILA